MLFKTILHKIWSIIPNAGAKDVYDEVNSSIATLNTEGFIQEAIEDIEVGESEVYQNCNVASLKDITNQVTNIVAVCDANSNRLVSKNIEYMERYIASDDKVYCQIGNDIIVNATAIPAETSIKVICYIGLPAFSEFDPDNNIDINSYFIPAIIYLTVANLCVRKNYADSNISTVYLQMYLNELGKLKKLLEKFKERGYRLTEQK